MVVNGNIGTYLEYDEVLLTVEGLVGVAILDGDYPKGMTVDNNIIRCKLPNNETSGQKIDKNRRESLDISGSNYQMNGRYKVNSIDYKFIVKDIGTTSESDDITISQLDVKFVCKKNYDIDNLLFVNDYLKGESVDSDGYKLEHSFNINGKKITKSNSREYMKENKNSFSTFFS